MKKTFFALVLSLATLNAAWAQFNSDKALYASKVERYTRMSKTGSTLTAVGGVLFIAGIVMISNSPAQLPTIILVNLKLLILVDKQ